MQYIAEKLPDLQVGLLYTILVWSTQMPYIAEKLPDLQVGLPCFA